MENKNEKIKRKIEKKFEVGFEQAEWQAVEPVLTAIGLGLSAGVASLVMKALQGHSSIAAAPAVSDGSDTKQVIEHLDSQFTELRLAMSKETHLMRQALIEEDNHSKQIVEMLNHIQLLKNENDKLIKSDEQKKEKIFSFLNSKDKKVGDLRNIYDDEWGF